MLKNVGDHVVAVHILGEIEHTLEDFVENGPYLCFLAVLQHSLDHSTSILMHTHLVNAVLKGIYDELDLLTQDLLDDLLHNMVAILIFNAQVNLLPDLFNQVILLHSSEDF